MTSPSKAYYEVPVSAGTSNVTEPILSPYTSTIVTVPVPTIFTSPDPGFTISLLILTVATFSLVEYQITSSDNTVLNSGNSSPTCNRLLSGGVMKILETAVVVVVVVTSVNDIAVVIVAAVVFYV